MLLDRLKSEAHCLDGKYIKVDTFLNHQFEPSLMAEIGSELVLRFEKSGVEGITKILTAEASGIPPAFAVAQVLNVPMIYARKKRPLTMRGTVFSAEVESRTRKEITEIFVSGEVLSSNDKVVIVDDFLGTGGAVQALHAITAQAGAELLAVACVIEKIFENARTTLAKLEVPIISLAGVTVDDGELVISA